MKHSLAIAISILIPLVAFGQANQRLTIQSQLEYNRGDYIHAIKTLDTLIAIAPKDGDAFFYRGLSKLIMGDNSGACSDIGMARSLGVKHQDKRTFGFMCDDDYKLKFLGNFFYPRTELVASNGYRPVYTCKDSLRGGLSPEKSSYDVTFYDLRVKLVPKEQFISGTNGIYFRVTAPVQRIQVDLFSHYKIDSIRWNNTGLTFTREYDAVFINFPAMLPAGSLQHIEITYSGKPQKAENPPWFGGFVWSKDKKGNRWDGVACEHLGASSWWPCKDHMSDEPDSMKMTYLVPGNYDLISNGTYLGSTPAADGFTAHTWIVRSRINNYNATFYMGKFTHFSDSVTNSEGTFPLDYYVLPYNLEKARETFKQTREIVQVYEELFGNFPFPKDGFAMIESPYEGMEHQGAIAYGNSYDKKGNSYIHKEYDYIIVHEAAHEWWGNSVSAGDMADMWIQEGFATYAELLFMEKRFGHDTYLLELTDKLRQIFNFWPLVQNRGVNENTFASNDVYNKGAALLHNLRCTINNDSLFFRIIKDFAVQNRQKIVSSDDFIRLVNQSTGKNFTPFFDKFLHDTNLPVLEYSWAKNGKNLVLQYRWTGVRDGFEMPFCIRSGNKSFRLTGTTTNQKVVLNNADTFRFYNILSGTEGVERNAYTYHWTRMVN